jgi:drug/metabolite transporter (DMT)-like permease
MNKHITDIGAYDKTITQLFVAGIVLVPYNLWTVEWPTLSLNISGVVLLAFVGIVHTGFAYYLYFGSMEHLTGQSIAIFSYIDPVVAVLASVVLLREPFNLCNLMGSFMIIGSSVVSELPIGKWRQSW